MGESRTVEILRKARKLIERPEAWTKGVAARDRDGNCVPAEGLDAKCWCIYGAVLRCASEAEWPDYAPMATLEKCAGHKGIGTFNDAPETTHADVLALFDRAIAAESAKETP